MFLQSHGLATYRWNNNIKTVLLFAFYPVLICGVTWLAAFLFVKFVIPPGSSSVIPMHPLLTYDPGAPETHNVLAKTGEIFFALFPYAIGLTFVWFIIAWFFQSAMIRKMSGAHEVTRKDEKELYNLLENLCIAQGVPMPKLNIIETHARNAFASGIDRRSYTVTVTRGLLRSLRKDEVEAVLAHELAHIRNNDVRLLIASIIFCGMFGFLAQMFWSIARRNLLYSRRKKGGQAGLALLIVAVVLWIGYFLTIWSRFAISRRREFDADAMAVEMTKNPEAMMRALMRISGRGKLPADNADIAYMCIENRTPFFGLFRTHPPMKERVLILSKMTNTPVPDLQAFAAPTHKETRFDQTKHDNSVNPWVTGKRHYKHRKKAKPETQK